MHRFELFQAVLDPDSSIDEVELHSGMEELKRRLEVLLGTRPEAPVDESERKRVGDAVAQIENERARVAEAGGRMLAAAFEFLGELMPGRSAAGGQDELDAGGRANSAMAEEISQRLGRCIEEDDSGRPKLTVTLPNRESLDNLASSLARLLAL